MPVEGSQQTDAKSQNLAQFIRMSWIKRAFLFTHGDERFYPFEGLIGNAAIGSFTVENKNKMKLT